MFITGPDVIKTVTGEEVTFEELGGAMTHASEVRRRRASSPRTTRTCLRAGALPAVVPAVEQPGGPAGLRDRRRPERLDEALTHIDPRLARSEPYDMHEVIRRVVDDGEFFEVFPLWAMNIVIGFARLDGQSVGIVGEPAEGARRARSTSTRARRRRGSCGSATRSTSRSSRSWTCPGFLPGTDQEYGGHHPPRREAPVRVRRGDRAADDRDHAQGVRRRVRRHELEAPARRRLVRVADRGDRGHGRGGRGERRVPQGDREGGGPGGASAPS